VIALGFKRRELIGGLDGRQPRKAGAVAMTAHPPPGIVGHRKPLRMLGGGAERFAKEAPG